VKEQIASVSVMPSHRCGQLVKCCRRKIGE
jgi:hypothetical protein